MNDGLRTIEAESIGLFFWNLRQKDLSAAICDVAREHPVRMLVLCEVPRQEGFLDRLAVALSQAVGEEFRVADVRDPNARVRVVASVSLRVWPIRDDESGYLTVYRWHWGQEKLLLAGIHGKSRLRARDPALFQEALRLSSEIRFAEKQDGISQTIVMGDLNMDPFDDGIIATSGFNAVPTRRLAMELEHRTLDRRPYPMFYNPMWSCFGDVSPGPPGSYFYGQDSSQSQFWHLFDQVLLRPGVLDRFDAAVDILDKIAGRSLLTERQRPDHTQFSDHLPLLCRLRRRVAEGV